MPEKTIVGRLLGDSSAVSWLDAVGDEEVENIHALEKNYSISWEETNSVSLVWLIIDCLLHAR